MAGLRPMPCSIFARQPLSRCPEDGCSPPPKGPPCQEESKKPSSMAVFYLRGRFLNGFAMYIMQFIYVFSYLLGC